MSLSSDQLWTAAQEELRFQVSRPGYEAWLKNARLLSFDEDLARAVISVPTPLARDWVSDRYAAVIRETLSALLNRDVEVEFAVQTSGAEGLPLAQLTSGGTGWANESPSESIAETVPGLNPRYTFSAFVVGNSSRFAQAACRAVADSPSRAYNPLFLYGGVGLGKTHLMHAVGHAVWQSHRQRVAYVTSESFMNQMITSIQENRMAEFRTRYRTVDVLLVDDIQFLAGKDRTQEEFFHTFNALQEVNRQIVITSDRPPREIPTLEERLRTRFEGGLMADIQPPDFETRLAILRSKLGPSQGWVGEDVLSFIAHNIKKNIRELEGALTRVLAHASITGSGSPSLDEVSEMLRDIIPTADSRPISVEAVQVLVAEYYGITVKEMISKRRDKHIVFPRQVAMYLIREEIAMSLPAIGLVFGGRDHTTVLHSYEKISNDIKEDPRVAEDIARLRDQLRPNWTP
ncbi:MAG: chromosomal replication initiator protein DnaA [Candidatus Dormibacteraeota bacterium]|nr:chromosomal replication initiator protein DnaA [Candidatus Dormibacteraeota bacterium]